MVLQAVRARTDHPTADQIFKDVHKLDPKISHGTVYRNLNHLCEDGLICHVRVPGADRYDLRKKWAMRRIRTNHIWMKKLPNSRAIRLFDIVWFLRECVRNAKGKSFVHFRSLYSFVIRFDRHLRCRCLPLPKRKNQTGENDHIDNAAAIFALSDVKNGLKCHGKRRLVVCGSLISWKGKTLLPLKNMNA